MNVEEFVGRLDALFSYDAESGLLRRKISRGNRAAGAIVGTVKGDGYLTVEVEGKTLLVHRVAWALFYGQFPDGDLDHRDRNRTNNRIANLRPCDDSKNVMNSRDRKRANGLPRCVYIHRGRITAQISVNRRLHYLGAFPTIEAAKAAADAARRKHYGEWACVD